jgi:methylated-DNA-[protein]-cysteine S-methyltransferase
MSLATPIGSLILAATDKSIVALVWNRTGLKRLGIKVGHENTHLPLFKEAGKQIREYFSGRRKVFDLPLDLAGTAFQKSVWQVLLKIPFGQTWSYQEVAMRIGNPKAVRAVGTANARNPVCIFVPCHRVVRLSGDLGGYAGGVDAKAFLLDLETTH